MDTPSLPHANIIALLGIGSLPQDERVKIVESAVELVETRTIGRIFESLNDEDKERLAKAFDEKDADTITGILEKQNIDVAAVYEEEIERVKQELLATKEEADGEV